MFSKKLFDSLVKTHSTSINSFEYQSIALVYIMKLLLQQSNVENTEPHFEHGSYVCLQQ